MEHRRVLRASAGDAGHIAVIDVTHPAFAMTLGEAEIRTRIARFYRHERLRGFIPKPIERAVVYLASRRSRLASALADERSGVVGGMTLYVAKLGPSQLSGAFGGFIDRKIAGSLPSWLARLRLEDMVQLLTEHLTPRLRAQRERPLRLFNIAGGPGSDSWNALLVMQRNDPSLLVDRHIMIGILDPDDEGPAFGARAVAALVEPGAPLAGLDVHFEHERYDWRDADHLRRVLATAGRDDALVAFSSEGGLFEYGSDEEIVANLDAIRQGTPADTVVVGSVTCAEAPEPFLRQFTVRPRTIGAFRKLARRAGWRVAKTIDRPLSYDVQLVRE